MSALAGALKPREIVELLDNYIVGQPEAKRAVAIALRNRWRRHNLPDEFKTEVIPKNILMIGPTGCGKVSDNSCSSPSLLLMEHDIMHQSCE